MVVLAQAEMVLWRHFRVWVLEGMSIKAVYVFARSYCVLRAMHLRLEIYKAFEV